MRRLLLAVAALTLVPVAPSHATSEPIPLSGTGCSYVTTAGGGGTTSGFVYGVVTVGDVAAPATTSTVTLTCSIQSSSYAHSAPDDFTTSGSGINGAVVVPAAFSVPDPPAGWPLGLCSRVDVTDANGTRTYWSNSQNGMWYPASWGTCEGAPRCLALGADCVWYLAFLDWVIYRGDEALCDDLRAAAPGTPPVEIRPDGDVYVAGEWIWDCPPYGS